MAELVVDRLVKDFGAVRAIDDVSFVVKDGEFLTLLGPSGCGKTTTLGAIAGLDRASGGKIVLGDRTFFNHDTGIYLPPEKRDIGLVFQSYALWPHMTVAANVEFPLKLRKLDPKARKRRIDEVLNLVEMDRYADRFPFELSGGQQQRVALARTLAFQPKLVLLDEPLSNLDAKLRERARSWLRQLQTRIGVTTVYVTHDQAEALALSDRIAVMNGGRVEQLDTPRDIYMRPANAFVADFIGSSNFIDGKVAEIRQNELSVDIGSGLFLTAPGSGTEHVGQQVTLSIRPEKIALLKEQGIQDGRNIYSVRVEEQTYLGARLMLAARLGDVPIRVDCEYAPVGDVVRIQIPCDACIVFPRLAGSNLH